MPRRRRTRASRLAALATGVLALLLGGAVLSAETTAAVILEGVVLVVAAAGGVKMWLHNCFESRLAVVLALGATVAGTTLSLTLGLPGRAAVEPGLFHAALLGVSALIAVLLGVDSRIRRSRRRSAVPPYAL